MAIKRLVCFAICVLIVVSLCGCDDSQKPIGYIDSFTCRFCGKEFTVVPSDLFEIKWDGTFSKNNISKAIMCHECGTTYAYIDSVGWVFADREFEVVQDRG